MSVESIGTPSSVPYKASKKEEEERRRYRAEDALRTMQRAEEIKNDPQLCKDMKTLAREQMQALKKVAKE